MLTSSKFQSTRPRGARLEALDNTTFTEQVSIHAPTWGATVLAYKPGVHRHVSIHAPTWGATTDVSLPDADVMVFQSTRPRGARHFADARNVVEVGVSIHAPTWGATRGARCRSASAVCFNPRAHVGRDRQNAHVLIAVSRVSIHAPTWGATPDLRVGLTQSLFQSTRPRGARRS